MSNVLQNVSANDMDLLLKENAQVIDIRTAEEWSSTGIIKDSHKLTFFDAFGKYDLDSWLEKFQQIVKNKDDKFILICAHAHRTKTVGDFLAKNLEYTNTYHLEGGIASWLAEGKEVVR